MAGYIGNKSSVTLVDGYTEAEADAEFVAKSTTGDLTLDVSGNINLDADGGNIRIKDGGTEYGTINKNGTANLSIYSSASDADMLLQGNDGGSVITALTLDMSDGGFATFNKGIQLGGNIIRNADFALDVSGDITLDADGGQIFLKDGGTQWLELGNGGSGPIIKSSVQDKAITFQGNDGGSAFTTSSQTVALFQRNSATGSGAKVCILSGNNSSGDLNFGDAEDEDIGKIAYEHNNNAMTFTTNTAERMRIDSSGNVLVDNTSAFGSSGITLGSNNVLYSAGSSQNVANFQRYGSDGELIRLGKAGTTVGSISVSGSATAFNTSSDYRLKENVVDLTGASARVNQLDVKRFNFISDDTNTLVDGFLAHEVATVVPEAITGTKDAMMDEEYEVSPAVLDDDGNVTKEAVMGTRSVPNYQGIDQSKLVPLLTAALQEALTEIASLKTRVEALEA